MTKQAEEDKCPVCGEQLKHTIQTERGVAEWIEDFPQPGRHFINDICPNPKCGVVFAIWYRPVFDGYSVFLNDEGDTDDFPAADPKQAEIDKLNEVLEEIEKAVNVFATDYCNSPAVKRFSLVIKAIIEAARGEDD